MNHLIFITRADTGEELFWDRATETAFVRVTHGSWRFERSIHQFHTCHVAEMVSYLDDARTQLVAQLVENNNRWFAKISCAFIDSVPPDLLAIMESYLAAIHPWPVALPKNPNYPGVLGQRFDLARMRFHRQCGAIKYYCGISIPGRYIVAKCMPRDDGSPIWLLYDNGKWSRQGFILSLLLRAKSIQIAEN